MHWLSSPPQKKDSLQPGVHSSILLKKEITMRDIKCKRQLNLHIVTILLDTANVPAPTQFMSFAIKQIPVISSI